MRSLPSLPSPLSRSSSFACTLLTPQPSSAAPLPVRQEKARVKAEKEAKKAEREREREEKRAKKAEEDAKKLERKAEKDRVKQEKEEEERRKVEVRWTVPMPLPRGSPLPVRGLRADDVDESERTGQEEADQHVHELLRQADVIARARSGCSLCVCSSLAAPSRPHADARCRTRSQLAETDNGQGQGVGL